MSASYNPATTRARWGESERGGERVSEESARTEVERRIIQRSIEESFRQWLIEDPKGAVEQELGTRLPEEVRVVALEESADTIYLVLPGTPMAGREGVELSDRELESVAGGMESSWNYSCITSGCGVLDPC
jgi:hypothetical protein